ncbi:Putative polinton-4 nvi [Gryllus bimaculatus]|nr:Putative polinton-4 nvi [Gryllus bimaculatus]
MDSSILRDGRENIYDDGIENYQYFQIDPVLGTNYGFGNRVKMEVACNEKNVHLSAGYVHILGSITKRDGSVIDTNTQLDNGFTFNLFSEASLKFNSKVIDHVYNPGIICPVKAYALGTPGNEPERRSIGLVDAHLHSPQFHIAIPLRYFFGLCDDYNQIIIVNSLEFAFVRSTSDDRCIYSSAPGEDAINAKINISKMYIKLPFVQPSNKELAKLLTITNQNKVIKLAFRQWNVTVIWYFKHVASCSSSLHNITLRDS